jgi:AbiV family abortive infection protein
MIPSVKTLEKLKEESYINAVRLFVDACKLHKAKSYASAFALSVLAIEEIGKLNMVDHICDDIILSSGSNPQWFLDHLFSRDMYRSHTNKQAWATSPLDIQSASVKLNIKVLDKLERAKQNAIYVGYSRRRINRPRKLTKHKSFALLREVHKILHGTDDLGFNGYYCFSDAASKARARRYLNKVDDWYERLTK